MERKIPSQKIRLKRVIGTLRKLRESLEQLEEILKDQPPRINLTIDEEINYIGYFHGISDVSVKCDIGTKEAPTAKEEIPLEELLAALEAQIN